MNRHQFQNAARHFRAGKISLDVFTERVFGDGGKDDSSHDETGMIPALPPRKADSHKGDYGRILIVAGSDGMAGAAALSGIAALRVGAGLVTVATAKVCQNVVASFHPTLMTVGLPCDDQGRIDVPSAEALWSMVPSVDCLAIGPGLGQSESMQNLLRDIYSTAAMPTVFDADGLNNLGAQFGRAEAGAPRVLTPHPGECRRLIVNAPADRGELEAAATRLALEREAILVLKGHRTLVTDGHRSRHNQTGNPGMATAGSGDVLTGIIAGLLGQGLSAWEASVLGCHLHGQAGDWVAANQDPRSLVATDILEALPQVLGRAGQRATPAN